ncbi:type II secretion system protein D precursor [mine drainage metagenome]|uniref:Type II secretion system protein D n=1 Tax=mine drainage metagenome TaxID=410659 RepID=A0A1J5RJY0_9ZZZZ
MRKNKKTLRLLCAVFVLSMSSCAHESTVQPSKGHIDGRNTATNQVAAESAAGNAPASGAIPKPVINNTYLPPPKPKAKEPVYSIVVYDTPVKEVLFAIARDSKLNVDINPNVQGRVTLNAVDQTLPAILERLSKQVDLTYKIQNNVLTIAPDSPVLRTYQINYVNMQRVTKGGISVANEIASSANVAGSTANKNLNISSTSVESESKNYFWDSLIQNIKDILAESDKEVLVNRLGTDKRLQAQYDVQGRGTGGATISSSKDGGNLKSSGNNSSATGSGTGGVTGSGDQNVQGDVNENSEKNLKEYKTLFAASVIANKETGVLSVRATRRQHQSVQEFIDRVQAGAKRQVLIEASIVEITLNDQYQAGVDWSRLGAGGALNGFTFKQDLLGTDLTTAPRIAIGYNKATAIGDLAASIRLLQTFGNTKVLSSPKLMVLNSQTAILKVVDNLVYFTVKADTTTSSTGPSVTTFTTTPHTVPVGVWMSVTPQINENSAVTLNVRPTIARQIGLGVRDPNPSLNLDSRIPEIQVREMESMLQVNSGNTVILGGLMQDEVANTDNGVPGLMSMPIIGKMFNAKNNSAKKTELVIFLRPTVIGNASLESDELASYKQYLPAQQLEKTLDASGER